MPTYSYRCTECGTAFDIQQAFTDDSLTECTQLIDGRACGGKLRKLFNSVGVTFNGSGFYRTDSRAGEKTSSGSSSSESSSSGSSSSSSSGESKPAAASAPAPSAAPASKE